MVESQVRMYKNKRVADFELHVMAFTDLKTALLYST